MDKKICKKLDLGRDIVLQHSHFIQNQTIDGKSSRQKDEKEAESSNAKGVYQPDISVPPLNMHGWRSQTKHKTYDSNTL